VADREILYDQRGRLVGVVAADAEDTQRPVCGERVALPPFERGAPVGRRIGG